MPPPETGRDGVGVPAQFPGWDTSDASRMSEALRERLGMTVRDKIEEVLDAIRPAIQADGGDVELLDYREEEGIVHVRLLGACESCPISMATLKDGIERRLRRTVPGVLGVIAV